MVSKISSRYSFFYKFSNISRISTRPVENANIIVKSKKKKLHLYECEATHRVVVIREDYQKWPPVLSPSKIRMTKHDGRVTFLSCSFLEFSRKKNKNQKKS